MTLRTVLTSTLVPVLVAASFAPAAFAQQTSVGNPNDGYPGAQPSYSQDSQRAYEQGRADQARDDSRDDSRGGDNGDYARNDAPPPSQHYDGYCYARKDQASATGAVAGAVIGGAIGNGASNRWDRGGNTVAGALVGAVLGSAVGRSSVDCYGGEYYAYDSGYYAPPPPPVGYSVVYFNSRPSYGYRYVHRGHFRPGPGYYHRW